jgi:sRNA-binding carbon storage regulator CsrA
MLVLTRKKMETISLSPAEAIPPNMTVAELFAEGPLRVHLIEIRGNQVRLGIEAPRALAVGRSKRTGMRSANQQPVQR